jgi:ribose 1,5-bisphosphokinase PhnN/predicted MPP superfamily phosphohydrolase
VSKKRRIDNNPKKGIHMKKIFFLTFTALMLSMMSFAQERIMVISDPHVIPQTEIDKQGQENFNNYMKTQRKMLEHSEPIWHALLDTALKYKPDLVLIPGDLTKDGEAASHDTVAAGIHRLEAAGIPVLVIPGNHDIPASNAWKTHYSGTFKNTVSEDAGSYSFASEPLPGVTVLGIDGSDGKASVGKLSASTLAWVEAQAKAAKAKGNTVIAMTHWQILEHFDGLASIEPASRFEKPDELRDLLMHNGVHLVLTGHFHVSGITTFRDTTGLTQDSLVEITTGSPITYPCPYRWMTLSKDRKSIEVTTEYINSLPGIADDLNTYSREWMREHTANLIPSLAHRFWGKILDQWDEKVAPMIGSSMAAMFKMALPQTDAEQAEVTATYISDPAINLYLFYSEASEARHPEEGQEHAEAFKQGMIDMLTNVLGWDFIAEECYDVMKEDVEEPVQSLVQDKTLAKTKHADVTDDLDLLLGTRKSSAIYAVNKIGWEKVYAYVLCKVGDKTYPYQPWPGVEINQAQSADNIFAFEFPQDYDRVIFNNGTLQTGELTWKESKPYFVLSEKKDGEGHYQGKWVTQSDIAAAKAVDDKIDKIGTVTDASKALIDAARAAYNALTADQKALVTKLAKLEAAEKKYADLVAANDVDEKINKIGTVKLTDASKALIDAARTAYNALTADQKALVTKLATLEAAEKKYADLVAANDVDEKINKIGTVKLTDASKALIDAARAAYNALTADQKALVTKLATLEAAEKKYADLVAANDVDEKINKIGTVKLTDASKALIDAARAAYNALTADQKALVTKLATLEAAEKKYADLVAANDVDEKINKIGTVKLTDASKALIDAARAAYNALTADQKALVTKLATLEAAEKKYADLVAANDVDEKINKIGTVKLTNASKALIDAARAAYNALTADQKALVTKLATLEAAEKKYADLVAANDVDEKIDDIGTVEYTDASKALIDAARAAYEALTDDQKALVTKLAILEAAEKAYEDLKAAATEAIDDIRSSDINIQKVLRNGKVYILVGEKMYDTTGKMVE